MSAVLCFDRFEIRPAERLLLVDGQPSGVGARAFDVLLALAERHDRIVSKAELIDLAWPGLVVEENNLTVQISALRRLLGPAVIATVVGRGYRLTVPPRTAAAPAAEPVPQPRLQRRLTAIVQADVVGWSRLVARNAPLATQAWKQIRTERIEKTLPAYGARAIELTAERVQLEFGSAVDAVEWSLELQAGLAAQRGAATPDDVPVHMRIGIAVDDAIVDDGRLVGDGVNVAADLQSSAGHGEVLVTHKVRDFVVDKLDAQFDPQGERVLRRVQRPVQVFRVGPGRPLAGAVRPGHLARVAAIAVLPFADASGTSYFGDGITEEIISTLSLNRALFVIAHNSTLRFREPTEGLAQVADELGVRYLVTGSVQVVGTQLRIRATLVFAPDQRVLWQDAYNGSTQDVFAFQGEIAGRVAAAVAPRIQGEEMARVRTRPTDSFDAYDCVLQALAGLYQLATPEFRRAGDLLQRAIELDPAYAQAHAHLAWWYSLVQAEGRGATADVGQRALDHALTAIRLDGSDAWALSVAGYMLSLQKKQHEQALQMYEQALAFNPSCAAAWARSGSTLSYMGRSDEALERIHRAMKLSPFDEHQFWHLTMCGSACFGAGRYDESAAWLAKALHLNPRFNGARRLRIAALAHLGELDEARELAQVMLEDSPDFSVEALARWSPFVAPVLERLLQGLRLAGLTH